jgi:multicomponent Na+:H+ antiporter subunit G
MDIITEILISAGLLGGSFFCLVSAFGCMRMKDSYTRMHVATKAVAFGGALLVITYILAQPTLQNTVIGAMVIGFFYMTLPLAGHFLGRAIYRRGIPPQVPFVTDEAEGVLPRHDTGEGA